MNNINRYIKYIRYIIISLDFFGSIFIGVLAYQTIPDNVSNTFAKDLYGIGISVLSIIFSVYFAALSIIISSSNDDFVSFLDRDGKYKTLINAFRYSLTVLFVALMYSIAMYTYAALLIEKNITTQIKILLSSFSFAFFYGLFAALTATLDSIKYALTRTKFLEKNKQPKKTISIILNEYLARLKESKLD